MRKLAFISAVCALLVACNSLSAQQPIGDAGVAWYTTWATGVAEAKRSNRPIFFMSAATTCSGIPGVF